MVNDIVTSSEAQYLKQLRTVLGVDASAPDDIVKTAIAYCQAAKLDPLRKPIAIISFSGKHQIVFTMQAITTVASRAGWAGSDEIVFSSETVAIDGVQYPTWGSQVVYKLMSGHRCAFQGPRVFSRERHQNSWKRAGVMAMYQKCITSAALRLAFPEELSHAYVEDEMPRAEHVQVDNSGINAIRASVASSTISVTAPQVLEATVVEAEPSPVVTNPLIEDPGIDVGQVIEGFEQCVNVEQLITVKEAIKTYIAELSAEDQERVKAAFSKRQKELK